MVQELGTSSGDTKVEAHEVVKTLISNVVAGTQNVTIAVASADGEILNDDSATIVIDDVTLAEGDAPNTTLFNFSVTLDAAIASDITIEAATSDGTATAADDYVAKSETLTFQGNQRSPQTKNFDITVNGDDAFESAETFNVVLSNLSTGGLSVTMADTLGVGTIENDDPGARPTVTEVILDSTQWTSTFRDWVDGGFNDGVAEGQRLSASAGMSVPQVNVDTIKVSFDSDVSNSLDASDFVLIGARGFDANSIPGAVPTVISGPYDYDFSTNTATIPLSGPLGPNEYSLTVVGSGVQDGRANTMGPDFTHRFVVLPGDSADMHQATTTDLYIVNGLDSTFVRDRLSGFLFDQPGNHGADGAHSNYDVRADVDGDGMVNGTDATIIRDRLSSFVQPFSPSPAMAAAVAIDELVLHRRRDVGDDSELELEELHNKETGFAETVDALFRDDRGFI